MSIGFNGIPGTIRTHGNFAEFDNSRASSVPGRKPWRALIIGQRQSTGTATPLVSTRVVGESSGDPLFGPKSQAAAMARAYKAANKYDDLYVIGMNDDGSGVAATKTITVTGTASGDGVIYLLIAGKPVQIPVKSGDAQNAIASAINAAVQASRHYSRLPYTTGVATNVVTATAVNKGTVANTLDIRVNYEQGQALPPGVTIVVAAGATGSVDPDIATALDALGDVQYDIIVTPYITDAQLETVAAFLKARSGPMVQKDGLAVTAISGTHSAQSTLANGLNTEFLHLVGVGGVTAVTGSSPTPLYECAAIAGAVKSFEAQADVARPLQEVALPGILPPPEADRFTREEMDLLIGDGVSPTYVDAGGIVRIERMVTTYKTAPSGVPDESYKNSTTMSNLFLQRWEVNTFFALKYPRHKLADDGTDFDPGQPVMTPNLARAEILGIAKTWERRGMIENYEQFKRDLIVERDAQDRDRLNYRMNPDTINEFRVMAGQIQFIK